jgi:ferric-dicitrate binding protein FerR (iron transport regulator)
MAQQEEPQPAAKEEPESDTVERFLRSAGPRPAVDAQRARRVRDTVHEAWRHSTHQRARVRRWALGGAGLAAAAGIVVAISFLRHDTTRPSIAMPPPAGRLTATTGGLRTIGGSAPIARVGDTVAIGAGVETAVGALATFALSGGGEARINEATAVRFTGLREISVERGTLYLDSGPPGASLVIRTPVGLVRDVGTRFEVALKDGAWRVRVRDGLVRYDRGSVQRQAGAGVELIVENDGRVVEQPSPTYGADWAWVVRAAPAVTVEGQRLQAFLDWAARESGRRIEIPDDRLRRTTAGIILHGSIAGMSVEEALDVILPTCGLTYRIEAQRMIVSRPEAAAGEPR